MPDTEQLASAIHDGTFSFTRRYLPPKHRTPAEMMDAAVCRRYQELKQDYEAFLAEGHLEHWPEGHSKIRDLDSISTRLPSSAKPGALYLALHHAIEKKGPELSANTMLWLLRHALTRSAENER